MEFYHRPVLLEECITGLAIKPNGIYIDATLGGGGHSSEILKRLAHKGILLGIDQDIQAIEAATERLNDLKKKSGSKAAFIPVNTNFKYIKEVFNPVGGSLEGQTIKQADGILIDLGVSSFQLDTGERGFSYRHDAPLDMRMDRNTEMTAGDIVNHYDESELIRVIRTYGEEKWAVRIAKFMIEARKKKEIHTTYELVEIIKAAVPKEARRDGPHPAKRTFQALRIEVNNELGILESTIKDSIDILNFGGRLCIITFHSLEDRIVKETFNQLAKSCTCPKEFPVCICGGQAEVRKITGKPIVPGREELEENSRARSARLRIVEKLAIN